MLSIQHPNNRWLISRSTLVDLKVTTQKTFFEVLEETFQLKEWSHYHFDRSNQKLTFRNGSEIFFSWLDDVNKIKGMELWRFYIDEVDEVREEIFMILRWRLRHKKVSRRIGFITSNSEGKNRTYQIFVAGRRIPEENRKEYYTYRASSLENKHLPSDYIDTLMTFDGTLFDRYVLGEFNIFEWQIYDMFDQSVHVIQPFDIDPTRWRDVMYWLDHWSWNPTSIHEYHVNFDWDIFVTREHYLWENTPIFKHANKLNERFEKIGKKSPHPQVIADPSIFNKNQIPTKDRPYPRAVADEYADARIHMTPWNNDVSAGIERVKQYLSIPKIYIFNTCVKMIEEIEWYKRDKDSGWYSKEKPIKKNDHAMDDLRYVIMTKFPSPIKPKQNKYDSLEEIMRLDIQEHKNRSVPWAENIRD